MSHANICLCLTPILRNAMIGASRPLQSVLILSGSCSGCVFAVLSAVALLCLLSLPLQLLLLCWSWLLLLIMLLSLLSLLLLLAWPVPLVRHCRVGYVVSLHIVLAGDSLSPW